MTQALTTQPQRQEQDPGALEAIVRLGGWLFRQRTWLPLPLALALLLVPPLESRPSVLLWSGFTVVALGELVRVWAVHHIGVASRTRSDRLGPLVSTGPFALVRNPLYLGNITLWVGFAVSARLLWMVPLIVLLLAFEYHAMVRWEEGLLESRLGEGYRAYAARVPRWIPSRTAPPPAPLVEPAHTWRETFFSERGTLIAIAVGYALLYVKNRI